MVHNIARFWQGLTMKSPLNSDPVVVLGGGVVIKKVHLIAFFFILLILGYLLSSSLRAGRALTVGQSEQDIGQPRNFKLKRKEYSRWPAYQTPSYNYEWFKRNCWAVPKLSISSLSAVIASWSKASLPQCREVYGMMMSIYDVSTTKTSVVIKEPFVDKVKGWLGNNEMLYAEAQHQTIIKVFNLYTREQVLVNPLRDKRPISKPDKPERQFVEEITAESKASCDFCNYKDFTAQDDFPRIENERSVSASNTFKWDKWHGLILTKGHHPLNWGEEDFLDLMKTAQQWFERVHSRDSEYVYPVIIWDLLPHASASQVHPHVHTNLNKGRYYGYSENWRNGGEDYLANTGANFFTDMVAVHKALGLTVQLGNATALAHLVPRKDDEVVVVSAGPDRDFFRLLYYTLRAYLDDMEKLCYSLAITLPPLNSDPRGRTPAFARVVTRGPVASMRSAISAVDLFIASNVNIDPYKVISYVRNSVEKRSKG